MAGNDGSLNFDTKIDSSGFQKGINDIGGVAQKVLKGAVAGVTVLGGAAIKVGSDFETGMSQVQAVSGASGEALEQLKEKAKEMGAKTKFSATESAEALNYMAMAGWKTEEMLGGIEGIMNLAAASGEDLAATSDIVTDALTAFGMKADDAGHFADILAAASSNANTNVGMMGETFKYVAPLAGALGYSAEDTATAIGLMANAGIKGSQAGTSLRSIMTRLAKPTKESAVAMEALRLSITDSTGEMKPLAEIIGDMRKGFAGLTEDEKANYAAMLGGQEAMSGLLAIVNASDADFEKLSGAINDCNGSATEMAEIMQDNLQGQLTILQAGLEGLGVSMYETMQDTAKDVVKETQGMVQQIQDAFNEGGFEGLVGSFGDVLAQIVQRIAEEAPTVINAAVNLVHSFAEGLRNAQGLGEAGAELIGFLVKGLLSSTGELWSTAIVIFTELLSGLSAELPEILETGKEAITQFGRALVENAPSIFSSAEAIISILFDGLMSALPQIATAGASVLDKLAEGIKNSLPSMISTAMQALVEFSGSLRENAGLLVDAGLNLIMSLAQSLIDNIPVFIETIPTIITNIAGIINDNAPKLLACGIKLLAQLAMGLIQAIPVLVENIPQIIEAIVSVFTAFNWISLGQNIISFITNGIKSLATSIPNAIKNIGETAMDWLRAIDWHTLGADIIDLIKIGVESLFTAIPNLLQSIGHSAVELFKNIDWLDLGANVVKGIISGITGALDGLWSAVGDLCSGMLGGIKGFFGIHSPSTVMAEQGDYLVKGLMNGISSMPDEMEAHLQKTVKMIEAWGQKMQNGVQKSMQQVSNTIVKEFSALPAKVWTCLVNVVTRVLQWGQQIVNTAKTAISNMISSIISLLSQLPGKVDAELSKVTSKLVQWGADMGSRMTQVGTNMVKGIYTGMAAEWPWLEQQAAKMADSLLKSTKAALEIHSPSRKFRDEVGRQLMPGTIEGVRKSMPKALQEMKAQAGELLAAMQGTVAASMNEISLNASSFGGARALTSAGTIVYNDNHQEQENNYHVPVVTPSEAAKAQREAFRKMAGGVK